MEQARPVTSSNKLTELNITSRMVANFLLQIASHFRMSFIADGGNFEG